MSRRAARKDANHNAIQAVFAAHGWSVADTSALGGGFPDIVAARGLKTILIEVKDGAKPPSERALTPKESSFRASWRGVYHIVVSVDEARALANERT